MKKSKQRSDRCFIVIATSETCTSSFLNFDRWIYRRFIVHRTLTIRSKDGFSFSVPVLTYTKDGSNSTHVLKHGSRKKSSFDRDLRSNFFLTSVSSIGFLSFDRELRSASRPSIVFYDRSLLLRSRSSIDFSSFDRQVFLRSTTSFFLLNQGEIQRNKKSF